MTSHQQWTLKTQAHLPRFLIPLRVPWHQESPVRWKWKAGQSGAVLGSDREDAARRRAVHLLQYRGRRQRSFVHSLSCNTWVQRGGMMQTPRWRSLEKSEATLRSSWCQLLLHCSPWKPKRDWCRRQQRLFWFLQWSLQTSLSQQRAPSSCWWRHQSLETE